MHNTQFSGATPAVTPDQIAEHDAIDAILEQAGIEVGLEPADAESTATQQGYTVTLFYAIASGDEDTLALQCVILASQEETERGLEPSPAAAVETVLRGRQQLGDSWRAVVAFFAHAARPGVLDALLRASGC